MTHSLTEAQKQILEKLATNFPYYSEKCLRIVTKGGELVPFKLNKVQLHIHEKLEQQKREIGRIRAVILKGRQEGCTTYIEGRFWHRTNFKRNQTAFVLAHQAESTLKIFGMAQRFRENLPEFLKIPLEKDTERAMTMSTKSSYTVGTAGSAQVGRGMTVQLLHASEVAFFEKADQLSTGLMQTVADFPDTEVIFESTANGPGGFFYDLVMGAIAEKNGYQLIFIPWYWCDDYRDEMPLSEAELDDEEIKYYELYASDGLTLNHLAWRRRKVASFGGQKWKFIQEYPFNPEEAFIRAEGRFYDLNKVYAAKKRKVEVEEDWPLILGIDQGRTGDSTVIARRRGRKIFPFQEIPGDDGAERDMRLAGMLAKIIDLENPDLVAIDTTNEHGALDRLHELGYSKRIVKGIHFGEQANDKHRHRNKRVEMGFEFKEWIDEDNTEIPDDQQFISEIGAMPQAKESSNNVAYFVPKDDIKKLLGWSPNKLDAAWLTFSFRVKRRAHKVFGTAVTENIKVAKFKSCLKTLQE